MSLIVVTVLDSDNPLPAPLLSLKLRLTRSHTGAHSVRLANKAKPPITIKDISWIEELACPELDRPSSSAIGGDVMDATCGKRKRGAVAFQGGKKKRRGSNSGNKRMHIRWHENKGSWLSAQQFVAFEQPQQQQSQKQSKAKTRKKKKIKKKMKSMVSCESGTIPYSSDLL